MNIGGSMHRERVKAAILRFLPLDVLYDSILFQNVKRHEKEISVSAQNQSLPISLLLFSV